MTPQQAAVLLATVAFAAFLLRKNLWRAVIALKPSSIRLELDAPKDAVRVPAMLEPFDTELRALGFERLGTHLVHPVLQPPQLHLDYVHPAERCFASTFVHQGQARFDFFTPAGDEGFVLTSNYRRPARDEPGRYSSGGMEQAAVERVFRAHQRRGPTIGAPRGPFDQPGLISALTDWYRGPGGRELRFTNAPALLWTAFSLGMVGAAFLALTRVTR